MIVFDFAPINAGYARNGIYDARIIEFLASRSNEKIKTSYLGNVSISSSRKTNNNTAFFKKENMVILKKVVEAIRRKRSNPGIQIASRLSSVPPNVRWVGNLSSHVSIATKEISEISDRTLDEEFNLIRKGIGYAIDAGFSVIQLHAAHGYLLSRLLNRCINQRTGKYAFGRLGWLADCAEYLMKLDPDAIFDIRLNLIDGIENESEEFEYKQRVIKKIIENGCSKVSLSNGFYDINKELIYPSNTSLPLKNLSRATIVAINHPNTSFTMAGNMLNVLSPSTTLPGNLGIALGRTLIADPDAINNFFIGKKPRCELCAQCHYYTKGRDSLYCQAWTSHSS